MSILETLEARRLLAYSITESAVAGHFGFVGTSGADAITITVTVDDTAQKLIDVDHSQGGSLIPQNPNNPIIGFSVIGGGGDDDITVNYVWSGTVYSIPSGSQFRVFLYGDAGSDEITTFDGPAEEISGGADADYIRCDHNQAANGNVYGDDGNDVMSAAAECTVEFYGGTGNDYMDAQQNGNFGVSFYGEIGGDFFLGNPNAEDFFDGGTGWDEFGGFTIEDGWVNVEDWY